MKRKPFLIIPNIGLIILSFIYVETSYAKKYPTRLLIGVPDYSHNYTTSYETSKDQRGKVTRRAILTHQEEEIASYLHWELKDIFKDTLSVEAFSMNDYNPKKYYLRLIYQYSSGIWHFDIFTSDNIEVFTTTISGRSFEGVALSLKEELKDLKEIWGLFSKPDLVTDLEFDDETGTLPNKKLDGGEKATLILRIKNKGKGTAFDTIANVECKGGKACKYINLPEDIKIGRLPQGQEKTVKLDISSAMKIPSSTIKLFAKAESTCAKNKFKSKKENPIKITTVERKISILSFGEYNGPSIATNGERIKVPLTILNSGIGSAASVDVWVDSFPDAVSIEQKSYQIPMIASNQHQQIVFNIDIHQTYDKASLPLAFVVKDGLTGKKSKKKITISLKREQPKIFFMVKQVGKAANKPLIYNGDKLEYSVIVGNAGKITARNLQMRFSSEIDKIQFILPPPVLIGNIEPKTEGIPMSFQFNIPRNFNIKDLSFTVIFEMDGFNSVTKDVGPIRIKNVKPDLNLHFFSASSEMIGSDIKNYLIKDHTTSVNIVIVNRGQLPAKNVVLELDPPEGIILADRYKRFHLPEIGVYCSTPVSIPVSANFDIQSSKVAIKSTIRHDDYPEIKMSTDFYISDREVVQNSSAKLHNSPRIELSNPQASHLSTGKSSLKLEGFFLSEFGIGNLYVYINGHESQMKEGYRGRRDIGVVANRQPLEISQGKYSFEWNLNLTPGKNEIELVCHNLFNIPARKNIIVEYQPKDERYWGLFVGIDKFKSPDFNALSFCKSDINGFHKYLTKQSNLSISECGVFLDNQATRKNIIDYLEYLVKSTRPDDVVILSFATHGAQDSNGNNDSTYIITHDADFNNIPNSSISIDALVYYLNKIPASRQLVFLDICHAGGFTMHSDKYLDDIQKDIEGRLIISSAGKDQYALEKQDVSHGVFTYFMLDALSGQKGLEDLNGNITVSKLFEYVSDKVSKNTEWKQQPEMRGRHSSPIYIKK